MNDDKPCCAAEAMRRVKPIEVGGVTVGLVMLDHTFARVRGLALANEAAVRTELMKCVTCYNYIAAILSLGIIFTPALAIDGETKVPGRVPPVKELSRMLAKGV